MTNTMTFRDNGNVVTGVIVAVLPTGVAVNYDYVNRDGVHMVGTNIVGRDRAVDVEQWDRIIAANILVDEDGDAI